jgi:hypothetical protein
VPTNGEPLPIEPPEADFNQSYKAAAELDRDMQDPSIDWTQVQGANDAAQAALKAHADSLQQMEAGLKGGQMIKQEDGSYVRTSEHSPFYRKIYQETGHAPRKADWLAESDKELRSGTDAESQNYQALLRHAKAEYDIDQFQKADKESGYNRAKYQIPKGAPAKKFIQNLWDKTHSPEFAARNGVGAKLQDIRTTLQGVKVLRDRAAKEYQQLTKKASTADEATIRAKAAELRSQNTRYNVLKAQERDQALAYRQTSEALDAAHPDVTLGTKKGVRLTTNNRAIETARPVVSRAETEATTIKSAAAEEEEGRLGDQIMDGTDPKTLSATTSRGKAFLQNEVAKSEGKPTRPQADIQKEIEDAGEPDEPIDTKALLEDSLGKKLEAKPYTGPNMNEGTFSDEDRAAMDAFAHEVDEPGGMAAYGGPTRDALGDAAILEGIKAGASDADIVKSYQDATGTDEATAKKAYGLLQDDPNVDTAGAVENNPYHGKMADYNIDSLKKTGTKGLLTRGKTLRNNMINKALLRSTAYGDHLAYKLQDASHLWTKLAPEDQALADRLRGHSISSVAADAKDPKAFTEYANRAKDIEDFIHAARAVADPFDITPYRQHYGAGFHLQDEAGKPTTIDQYEGKNFSFQQERKFNTYDDIENGSGLSRSTKDFHEDLTKDVIGAQNHIAPHSLFYGLKQAFGDDRVAYGKASTTANVALKDFQGVYADKEIADRINARANYKYEDDALGHALKGYDTLNQSMKNIKLSMGGFHNINEMLNQAALNPTGAAKAAGVLVDPKLFRDQMNVWDANGTMEKALHTGLTLGGGSEFGDGGSLIDRGKYNPVRVFHDALFGRQIPFSKMQVFERYTKGLDLNKAADYDKMRGISRGINNTFGGINRLVDGMSPTRMKQFSRAILAVDYNEGQVRTLLTSLDPRKLTTTEGRMARQVVVGRATILALPGTVQAISQGKIGNNPEEIAKFVAQQYVNPTLTTGDKTAGGNPKRITLIAGIVNKVDRAVAPALNSNNPNKFSGLESELGGNLGPAASLAEEEKANSDYYGNPMHGKGLNAAEDVGQALNAAAPIPFSPGARVVAGVGGLKNNPVVKLLSGGQQPITPGEAAIDTSGIGRVSADPNAPEMQIMNNRELVREGLSPDDQGALDSIHPSWNPNSTKVQQAAVYNNPNYEINKWTTLADNRQVFNAEAAQNAFAVAHGEPGNPLFALSPHNQAVIIRYEQLKASDPGSDANDTAAVIYAQNKGVITKFENDTATYETQMNALYKSSGGTQGDNSPQITPGGVPYPTVSASTQNLVNQYYKISDSKTRAQFITDNPEINQYFTAMSNYENAKRASLNEPLLKDYPQAPPALNNWINQYTAASKTERTAMRDANTNNYNAMSDYFAKVDEYNLALTGGQAKFQGQNFSQANLKEIYNLGQYDIAPPAGAGDQYTVDPQTAYTDKTTGVGASSGTEDLISKLENDLAYHAIHEDVKYAGKAAKSRKIYVKRFNRGKPIAIKKTGPPSEGGKITLKSTPTA